MPDGRLEREAEAVPAEEKAAREAAEKAAKEEAEVGRRPRRNRDMDVPGPPVGLIAVLILLLMIGGSVCLGLWLSSASSPAGGKVLPADFGTSEEKGGYISEEGLPERGGEHEISGNPAGDDNLSPEEMGIAGDGTGDGTGGDQGGLPAGDPEPGTGDGDDEAGVPADIPADAVRIHLPGFVTGTDDPDGYAREKGWFGAEAESDGSAVYVMTRAQQEEAVSACLAELESLAAGPFGSLERVEPGDTDSYSMFRAYIPRDREEDTEGWKADLAPVLSKAAERMALAGSNNLAPSATVYYVDDSGVEVAAGSVFYVNGQLTASAGQ